MIDKDYFKDNFDYKKSELFKHSVALWQAGFLNTDKDTARVSFVKEVLAKDFFIAPYKDNKPLIISKKTEKVNNRPKERIITNPDGIFNNWDTLYILCLNCKFIVRRRFTGSPSMGSFEIFDRFVCPDDNGHRNSTFTVLKTNDHSILTTINYGGIVLSWEPVSHKFNYAIRLFNTEIDIGPITKLCDRFGEFYACRALVLYIIYRAYILTMDNYLSKLAQLKTHTTLEQENFYKEIIGFKITKLYRNPLTPHRGDEIPLIWNQISYTFNFPETIAEIEDKIHDCSMFNEYLTGKMLSEKSNKFAVGAIIAAVVICIVQLIAPFVQNLIMK